MQQLTVLQSKAILAGLHTCSMPNLPKRTFLFYLSDLMSSAYTVGSLFWLLAAGKVMRSVNPRHRGFGGEKKKKVS